MSRLFGTDGVRGVVGVDLTPEFLIRLSLAIGAFFKPGSRILIGMDFRAGNVAIKRIVEGALVYSGLRVYDAGITPTPALQYVIREEGFDGGVMITASHNPPEYSGVKVIGPHGIEVDRDEERIIEEYFWDEKKRIVDWREMTHSVQSYSVVNDIYIEAVVSRVDREKIASRGFRVLVDPVNNTGVLTTPVILRKLGVEPIVVNGYLDTKPARLPEPTSDTLTETAKLVSIYRCDLGVAHDGDADRAILIDDKGRVQWGDRTAPLLARHLVVNRGERGRVYTGVSSSIIVEEVLKPLNVDVVWMKVGSVDIAHAMRRGGDALCGFEENGGFMYPPHQFVRDGGMTTALFLEYMAYEKKNSSSLYDELPRYHVLKTKYRMSRERAVRVVERIRDEFRNERLVTIDGVKVVSRDYWFLVRPSGTEPLLRVMAEARSEDVVRDLIERIEKIVREVAE